MRKRQNNQAQTNQLSKRQVANEAFMVSVRLGCTMTENRSASMMCGAKDATYDLVARYQPPKATTTYAPVSHTDLIDLIRDQSEIKLPDYNFRDENFGLTPLNGENSGAKLFGVMTWENESSPEMGLSIGFRNSYDQSLAVGLVAGSKVFVCSNLMFNGDIMVTRKHTGDVLGDIEEMISSTLELAPMKHRDIIADSTLMKEYDMTSDQAFSIFGMAYGRGILRPRQLLRAKNAWEKPPQEDFEDRNLWSVYNAITEALKSSSPRDVMENPHQKPPFDDE